jgi:hypothetical protein
MHLMVKDGKEREDKGQARDFRDEGNLRELRCPRKRPLAAG